VILTFAGALVGVGTPAIAEDGKWDYPHPSYMGSLRSQQGDIPQRNLEVERYTVRCRGAKHPCLTIYNNADVTRIIEMRLSAGESDRSGQALWSGNLLPRDGLFTKSILFWEWKKPPKVASCHMEVKLLIRANGVEDSELVQGFDFCGQAGPGILVFDDEASLKKRQAAVSATH
jgi:hypothetical protein